MAYLKPLGLKKKKKSIDYMKVFPLAVIAIMVGSMFIVFTFSSTVDKVSLRVTSVDVVLGNPNDMFNNEIELVGNITALQLVRSVGLDVQFENETFKCIQNYCNGAQNWEFYLNGGIPLQPADELIIEKDDQLLLIFR